MKQSHYSTPRSIEECQFALNADPIEKPQEYKMQFRDKAVIVSAILSAIALAIIMVLE